MICEDELMKTAPDISDIFRKYVRERELSPLFLQGDALSLLQQLPDESIDCCMTSPPYWNKRQYRAGSGLPGIYRRPDRGLRGPPDGIVLDPFCGTGTTTLVARKLSRKSIGIDISKEYLQIAEGRN